MLLNRLMLLVLNNSVVVLTRGIVEPMPHFFHALATCYFSHSYFNAATGANVTALSAG